MPEELLGLSSAAASTGLALWALWRGWTAVPHRFLAAGLLLLAAVEIAAVLGETALEPGSMQRWQSLRLTLLAFVPGVWLLFALTFARASYRASIEKWRWPIAALIVVPLALVVLGRGSLVASGFLGESGRWLFPLGRSGYLLHGVLLIGAVLVLMNLESTMRASVGSIRWQIKYMLVGASAIFAAQVYTSSQALLYSIVNPLPVSVGATALLVGSGLMLVSFWRSRLVQIDLYLSDTLIYRSLTLLVVGIYLVAIGGIVQAVRLWGGGGSLPLATFVVFLALVLLVSVLLSDRLRRRARRLVSLHLRRPRYDYRKLWSDFTARTASALDVRTLSAAIAKMVAEVFGISSVSIWILNESEDELRYGASTSVSESPPEELLPDELGKNLLRCLRAASPPDGGEGGFTVSSEALSHWGIPGALEIRRAVPLMANRRLVGFLTLSAPIGEEALSMEDRDLLKTMADQTAAHLLKLRLSERLLHLKEMEAFQTLSAFFVHDLKNLASRLSLALQNLPSHYDDPSFRQDLLKVITRSVEKINDTCGRLSPLSRELELSKREVDFGRLVDDALAGLEGSLSGRLVRVRRGAPVLEVDPDAIHKLVLNLVLNANEAIREGGTIEVTTAEDRGWAVLWVEDDGCGMSREFVARSLFRPFQTSKKQGLGIGLFHCKKVVEAHGGRIEVESAPGKGSRFRVALPMRPPAGEPASGMARAEKALTSPGGVG